MVYGALDARPITCGTVTRIINGAGFDVKRSAVERSLQRLQATGKVGYTWTLCERNGFMVNGRHWYDVQMFSEIKEKTQ
jgi:hypothetical protein